MTTINTYKKSAFEYFGYTDSIGDAEYKWLAAQVPSFVGSIPDMWMVYLSDRGFASGSLKDRQYAYLTNLGYNGSLSDMLFLFWKNGAAPAWAANVNLWWDATKTANINGFSFLTPTDTHASTIYAPNAAGVYAPFAANVLTRTDLGLQTVPTQAQLLSNPTDFTQASWNNTVGVTGTANAAVAPDGTTTMTLITESSANSEHGKGISNASVTAGSTYDYVIYAQSNGRTNFIVRTNLVAAASFVNCGFLLSGAGSVTRAPAGYTLAIQRVGTSNTYMISVSGVADATASKLFTNDMLDVAPTTDGTPAYLGDGVSGVYLWGGNLYVGAFAVPPILSAATVAGNQQVIDLTGRLGTGVAGLVQITPQQLGDANSPRIFTIDDGTGNNRFSIFLGATQIVSFGTAGGVGQSGQVDTYNPPAGTPLTVAFAYASGFMAMRIVGRSALSNTAPTYPTGMNAYVAASSRSPTTNLYAFTRKLALSFGAQDQTSFDAMYARAVLAAST